MFLQSHGHQACVDIFNRQKNICCAKNNDILAEFKDPISLTLA